ncbi:putative ribonuclease H-like domain-containing protein [Tanacetum coccineum]
MEFESAQSNTTAKLPILKLGEYEIWVIRIKQYFQVQDYALWEVIENEKTNKKNDVKARSLLLMALPNEHQLTFSQYSGAKTMFAAIETRFGVWMNKADIETMSIDDLYNNFKIVEQDVKKFVGASSGAQNIAFMTAPSTNSTNDVNTANPAYEVSIVSPNINTACPQDLEQIPEDDLEAMDLKWQLSLLSMREKMYFQRTGKKIFINANDTAGYDKSKVECFNYHKMGYFARECRAPRNKEGQFRYQDNTRKQGNNKDTSSKAMLAIDGVGFDWSDMAEEQVQTNMALMAFSDFEVYNDKTCTKTCLKNYETLKKWCDDLIVKLNQTEFIAATYKRGLATIEEQLVTYRKNEVLFSEEVVVLKREVACKYYEINILKSEFEKFKQEKEGIEFKIEKFNNASKSLDKLLGSQITDKSKKGLGYNVVPLPHPLIYNRPKKLNLSYSGLDEFKDPEFKSYGSKDSELESNIVCDKKSNNSKENSDDSLVKEQVSEDTSSFVESPLNVDKETVFLVDKKIEFIKPKNHEKPINCNYHQKERMVSRNNYNRVDYDYYAKTTHPSEHRNMTPRAVLLKTGLIPLNTVRPINTAHPKLAVHSAKSMSHFSKQAQSTDQRPFYKKTALTSRYVNQKLNTAMRHYHTERPRAVNTARSYTTPVNAVREKKGKPQQDDTGFINSGCSRHMTGNIAYLLDFKEFDGGYVTFRGGAHGDRISGNGTLKADSLDFKDVYFVNELKFNLFSVSQMCHKKNYVLFTDTECLVLSPNFKLPDESQILLKIPRKDNMYSFDMKNIVPKESLNFLVAKATLDESMLWHRRLGHINFKNINKLVKDNLVRGLPTKHFENDQTCVACLKGKQHRASCKSKVLNPITKPLFMLHIDLFGLTFNKILVVKPYNKTPYELSRGLKPTLNFMRPFRCHVTILNTLDNLGKLDGKSDEGFFVRYSLSSKAFRVYNTRTRRIEENLHIGFLENKPMIEGNGPKWLFDIDSLTQSMNYVPVVAGTILNEFAGTISNESAGTQEELNAGTSAQKEKISQDCIMMPIWKDASYFDLPFKDVDKSKDDSSPKEVNAVGQHVNTASLEVNTGRFKLNTVDPLIEPTSIIKALSDSSWVEEMQEELLQFKLQQVWILVDFPIGKRAIRIKWIFRNKKGERGIVIRNKAMLVAQVLDKKKRFSGISNGWEECIYMETNEEEVYVDDIIFGSTNKALCTGFEKLMKDKFQMIDLEKPLVKDGDADDVDVHLCKSIIGSLMYLTASRLDIMFAVCACARFQVTPMTSHLLAVKRIFRYLKGKPTLGLWYSRDSPFELVAYTDSDYAGATQDRKSTTGGSEYVAAASCCGQVLWIQNQLLDYGYNFMNTVINIDNNSTICIIENPVQHSKTKHIEIRHHFIRDYNAKKLIQMVKIHTDHNVADLLTKGFDAGRHVKRGRDTKIPQSSGPPIEVGDEVVHKELCDRNGKRLPLLLSSLEQSTGPSAKKPYLEGFDAQAV